MNNLPREIKHEEWHNDGQRNKLNGMALEKVVRRSNPNLGDISIKKIIEEMINKETIPECYIVKVKFKLNDKEFNKGIPFFSDNIVDGRLSSKEVVINRDLKICANIDCKYHKQSKLYQRKERKCHKCFERLEVYTQKSQKEVVLLNGLRDQIISYLIEKEYIKLLGQLQRRLDHFEFLEDKVIVIESKNHLMLEKSAVKSSMIYPLVLKKYSKYINKKCDQLIIVHKGEVAEPLEEYFLSMEKIHEIKVNLVGIEGWINQNKTQNGFIKSIVGNYNKEHNKYEWYFEFSDEPLREKEFKILWKTLKEVTEFHLTQEQVENQLPDSRGAVVDELTKIEQDIKKEEEKGNG